MGAQTLALMLLPATVRLVRGLLRARRRRSAGGKRITKEEWRELLRAFGDEALRQVGVSAPEEE
jgi:hypothetical protein